MSAKLSICTQPPLYPPAGGGRQRVGQKGVAAVELAIVMIPLLLIVFGITEFGRAMYQYNTLAKATRNAARYLTAAAPGAGNTTKASCLARYGNEDCAGALLAEGLTADKIKICDASNAADCPGVPHASVGATPPVNLITVKIVGFQFTPLVTFILGGATITFSEIGTTMRQVL